MADSILMLGFCLTAALADLFLYGMDLQGIICGLLYLLRIRVYLETQFFYLVGGICHYTPCRFCKSFHVFKTHNQHSS